MNTAAQEYLDNLEHQLEDAQEEVHRLAEQRDELLEALEAVNVAISCSKAGEKLAEMINSANPLTVETVRAVIAKIKGPQP